jgi:putative transposase
MARRYKRGTNARDQSQGWREAVGQVDRLHARCADIRKDVLHQATVRVVRKAAGATIILLDMQISRLLRRAGKRGPAAGARNAIAPLLARVGIREIRRQIEYKQRFAGATRFCEVCRGIGSSGVTVCGTCQGRGRMARVESVPNGFPSTRMCSACGVVRATDPGYSSWACGACGQRHARELNSARNLRDFAGGTSSGRNGGRADRRKTSRKPAQWPAEPDQSASETTLTTVPDGGRAVLSLPSAAATGQKSRKARLRRPTMGTSPIQPEGRNPPDIHRLRSRSRGELTSG